jgi:hypothetical protein
MTVAGRGLVAYISSELKAPVSFSDHPLSVIIPAVCNLIAYLTSPEPQDQFQPNLAHFIFVEMEYNS